VKLAIQDLLQM